MRRWTAGLLLVLLMLGGCAGISVRSISTGEYIEMRRGDVLSHGRISSFTRSALQVLGLDAKQCEKQHAVCTKALGETLALDEEQRLASLSELWMGHALRLQKQQLLRDDISPDDVASAYIETARYAYAYLFMTQRHPSERAFEERQTQVRDYYNFAVQETSVALFSRTAGRATSAQWEKGFVGQVGRWRVDGGLASGLSSEERPVRNLIAATSIVFDGLRNTYRRDGVGAELVMQRGRGDKRSVWGEAPFSTVSAVMTFPGQSLDAVLHTDEVSLTGYDPYQQPDVRMGAYDMPLAANFSSAYGMWLANSGFARQALGTLFGRGEVLEKPRIFLMQPYDPKRRVIVMLHGLASSPEAWINVANEVLGDERLRHDYQIWQVYYPTNVPLVFNHREIREAIDATFADLDPTGKAPASHDMVLIGHSMGGVLARLMVTPTGDALWRGFEASTSLTGKQFDRVKEKFGDYARFDPMSRVGRAIFIAAPHRGTPVATNFLARLISGLFALPVSIAGKLKDLAQLVVTGEDGDAPARTPLSLSSIDGLSDKDPFILATAALPVAPHIPYHSIIGNDTPELPLAESSDGVVPYKSAHLDGAVSELVIPSWHSVQEHPRAIMEIRRILHVHLDETKKKMANAQP